MSRGPNHHWKRWRCRTTRTPRRDAWPRSLFFEQCCSLSGALHTTGKPREVETADEDGRQWQGHCQKVTVDIPLAGGMSAFSLRLLERFRAGQAAAGWCEVRHRLHCRLERDNKCQNAKCSGDLAEIGRRIKHSGTSETELFLSKLARCCEQVLCFWQRVEATPRVKRCSEIRCLFDILKDGATSHEVLLFSKLCVPLCLAHLFPCSCTCRMTLSSPLTLLAAGPRPPNEGLHSEFREPSMVSFIIFVIKSVGKSHTFIATNNHKKEN